MRTTTGDQAKSIDTKSVSLLNVGLILKTDLTDATKPINATAFSGKRKGGLVVGTDADGSNPALYIASGSNATDAWIQAGTGAYILPDATQAVSGGVKMAAYIAQQSPVTVSGADVAALTTSTNAALTLLTAKINLLISGARAAGQMSTT